MKRPSPILIYTTSRLLLFFGCASVLVLLGVRGYLLIVLAFVMSGLLSFVLLSRQRDEMSARVIGKPGRLRQRLAERTKAEDDLDDQLRAQADDDGFAQ